MVPRTTKESKAFADDVASDQEVYKQYMMLTDENKEKVNLFVASLKAMQCIL